MTVEQIDVVSTGTCQCGCCGGEQEPKALDAEAVMQALTGPPQPVAHADEDDKEEKGDTRSAGCQCGESATGCACSGGADCTCGSEQVA